MVKQRDPVKPALTEAEKAAKAEMLGNAALPKPKRTEYYKAINIPFKTEDDYLRLVKAAQRDKRKPTDFIKAAIKTAIERQEAIENQTSQH